MTMKLLRTIIFIVTLALACRPVSGETPGNVYNFRHIDSRNGLTNANVKCIVRDNDGFLWFGTKNGLNRYDGNNMKRVEVFDTRLNRGNNNIGALCVDNNSNLWVGTDRGIYIYDQHTEKISYVDRRAPSGAEADNWVQSIRGDKDGNVWALLPDVGIFLYTPDKVRHFRISSSDQFKTVHPSEFCIDPDGNVWVVTTGLGLFKYDPRAERFQHINVSGTDGLSGAEGLILVSVCVDGDGNLVMGTSDGHLYRYDIVSNRFSQIRFPYAGAIYLRALHCHRNKLLVGSQTGLFIIDMDKMDIAEIRENPLNPFSLSDNAIYCIYGDKESGVWLGTLFGGVNYYPDKDFRFENYGIDRGLSSRIIIGLARDSDGKIWIGTENAGVNLLDPAMSTVVPATVFSPSDKIVLSMASVGGNVYTGFMQGGLQRSGPGIGKAELVFPVDSVKDSNVYCYLVDSKGNEWVGVGFALYRRTKGEPHFRHIPETSYDWIYAMLESRDGNIWFATMGNGIWRYNPANGSYKCYIYDSQAKNPSGLRSNSINSITEDAQGVLWFSTDRGGLSRYNKDTDDFTTFGVEEGLPDDMVYDVLEDEGGNLWFGTNNGLVRFTPSTGKVKVFTTKDGLPGNQFNYKSALRMPDGKFYFGGTNGVVSFYPAKYHDENAPPRVYFTELSVMNDPVRAGDEGMPLSENILFTEKLELGYDQSTFSLTVATPDLIGSGTPRLSYRLLPVNKEWITMNDSKISFVNLAPGQYRLEVMAEIGNVSGVKELEIVITPPWYESVWALLGYALLIVVACVIWFRWYRNRKEAQLQERQEAFTAIKEKEVYRSKVDFFTEIAHEIRTPLSLIDLPLEAIEDMEIDNEDVKRYVSVSRMNVNRLLKLTAQLLDFQKIDSQKLMLKSENVDIPALVKSTARRFEPAIQLKGRNLVCELDGKPLVVAVDREALTKILSNLLNNALKYGVGDIRLRFGRGETTYSIVVESNGNKIATADREKIFTMFFQSGSAQEEMNGVGIGLPLSRSLAMLLGGTLVLEDNADDRNIFTLTLPVTEPLEENIAVAPDKVVEYAFHEDSNQTKRRTDVCTVLLVEDNDSIRSFIAEQLRTSFIVETASNGAEALEKTKATQFDIIVTDIMMPVMDGLELCRAVKEDVSISQTPVIFITAKNDLDSKIKGLQYGAEAYVEKPFSIKYLKQLIRSILENRRREREAFSKNPLYSVDKMQMSKAEEEFMAKVTGIIEDNVSEEDFNVETLCDRLCMSRSSLLRKIKTIFNLSPIELIRVIKLKKAAELIREGSYRISDVCFMVGITSPSYFSKLFFKQFGISPKDFEKQCRASSQQQSDNPKTDAD